MNKDLKDNVYNIPPHILKHIETTIENINKEVVGIDRARGLLKEKKISYHLLKKIIHDMKNMDKLKEKDRYNLMGGDKMERWATTFLNNERNHLKNQKQSKQNADNIGNIERGNNFIKKHSKKQSLNTNINITKNRGDANTAKSLMSSLKLFEEIENIKKLI